MWFRQTTLMLAAACSMAGGAAIAQSNVGTGPGGNVASTAHTQAGSLHQLEQASDRLRHSIQALAQKSLGPDRDRAISETHEALLRTQQAMTLLPADMGGGGMASAELYDESVRKLLGSAESLRRAVQAMAQQPAGERRKDAIRDANWALLDTQTAIVAALHAGSAQTVGRPGRGTTKKDGQGGRDSQRASTWPASTSGIPAAALVLPSNAHAGGTRLADGCWVRFFDDKNFKGNAVTLAGPVEILKMKSGNIWRDWDSAQVGPKATVRTFDNEDFNDRSAVLSPGQSIPDLRQQKLDWFEEVQSARISCG